MWPRSSICTTSSSRLRRSSASERFPRLSAELAWEALVDTAEPTGLVSDGKRYVAGHSYPLRARSFALFINRAETNGRAGLPEAVLRNRR